MDCKDRDKIALFIKRLSQRDFQRVLQIMNEDWGKVLREECTSDHTDRIGADIGNLPFTVPSEFLTSSAAIGYFVAKATERALHSEWRR